MTGAFKVLALGHWRRPRKPGQKTFEGRRLLGFMVGFFERMKQLHKESGAVAGPFAAAFSSHPADEKRVVCFKK